MIATIKQKASKRIGPDPPNKEKTIYVVGLAGNMIILLLEVCFFGNKTKRFCRVLTLNSTGYGGSSQGSAFDRDSRTFVAALADAGIELSENVNGSLDIRKALLATAAALCPEAIRIRILGL